MDERRPLIESFFGKAILMDGTAELIRLAVQYKKEDKQIPVDVMMQLNELGIGGVFDEDKQED